MNGPVPARGELWYVDLDPTRGHEQAGQRSALVISVDTFNRGPADMVVIIPVTTRDRGIPLHVPVAPPEGGLKKRSVIKCDNLRAVARQRLTRRLGEVSPQTMADVADRLRALLGI